MARKGWDALSEPYRNRLEKQGVTREQYSAGTANLAKARGHKSSTYERNQSAAYRRIDKFVAHFSSTYGKDEDDVREALMANGRTEAENIIRYQQDMEKLYDRGHTAQAAARYKMPPSRAYPDWMFYYHGTFS